MAISHRSKGFERALDDALGADVDPAARSHLAVHHQTLALEFMKVIPVGPRPNQIRISDQHSRRIFMSAKDANRLAGLNQQRLVIFQALKRAHNCVVRFPIARGLAGAAIDDQLVRFFRYRRIEIVHQAAQGGLLVPALTVELGAARRVNVSRRHGRLD